MPQPPPLPGIFFDHSSTLVICGPFFLSFFFFFALLSFFSPCLCFCCEKKNIKSQHLRSHKALYRAMASTILFATEVMNTPCHSTCLSWLSSVKGFVQFSSLSISLTSCAICKEDIRVLLSKLRITYFHRIHSAVYLAECLIKGCFIITKSTYVSDLQKLLGMLLTLIFTNSSERIICANCVGTVSQHQTTKQFT